MWQRIKLIIKAWFRKFWLWVENPKPQDVLQKYIKQNNNQMLKLNKQIAEIIKQEKLLELQYMAKQNDITEVKARIEEVVLMGQDKKEEAKGLIVHKRNLEQEADNLKKQWKDTQLHAKKALKIRQVYNSKMQNRTQELQKRLNQLKNSQNVQKTNDFVEGILYEIDRQEVTTINLDA